MMEELPRVKTLDQVIFEETVRFHHLEAAMRRERIVQQELASMAPFVEGTEESQQEWWLVQSWKLFRDGDLRSPLEWMFATVFWVCTLCLCGFIFFMTVVCLVYIRVQMGV